MTAAPHSVRRWAGAVLIGGAAGLAVRTAASAEIRLL